MRKTFAQSFLVLALALRFCVAHDEELDVSNRKFTGLGLNPITVEMGVADEVLSVTKKYAHRCDKSKVLPSSFWNKARASAAATDGARTEDKQNM